jgi:peptidoglycan/LPS O-acetylase OafA/YrhL
MRLQIIDYLRGYSIFTIVLFHLFQNFTLPNVFAKAINFGGAGVHVFVLCSGFGLCLSQLNKPLNYIGFLKKRFLKIYFPYIIVIFISALIPFVYTQENKLLAMLSHVFLFKMFDEQLINSFGGQFWFISMILQFYLIFPILFLFVKRCKRIILITLFISLIWATFIGIIGKFEFRIWNSFFLQYLWEFILGMMLAKKYNEDKNLIKIPDKKSYLTILALLGIAIVGYTGIKGGILKLYNDVPSLIGYLSLALLIYSFKIKQINGFFIYINKFSYEWYLVHILIFICVFHFTKSYFNSVVCGTLALLLSYVFAISYHLILKKILYRLLEIINK